MPVAGPKQSKGPGAADLLTQSPINIHKRLGSVGFLLTVNLRCPNSNEAWLRPFHLFKCDAIHQYCQVLVGSTLLAGIDWTKSACLVMTAEPATHEHVGVLFSYAFEIPFCVPNLQTPSPSPCANMAACPKEKPKHKRPWPRYLRAVHHGHNNLERTSLVRRSGRYLPCHAPSGPRPSSDLPNWLKEKREVSWENGECAA